MSDFIREVQEEYRRERVVGFLTRFQVPLALLVVALLVGVAWWRIATDNRVAAAQSADARMRAAEQFAKAGKSEQAEQAFDAIAATAPAGYRLLAGMRAAEMQAKTDPAKAAARFDAIATQAKGDSAMADTATFRAALIRADSEDPATFEKRYGAMVGPGFTYAASMRELLALAALKRQDFTRAKRFLDDLMLDTHTPPAMRERAQVFRDLVTGGPVTQTNTPVSAASVAPVGGGPVPNPDGGIAPVETLPPPSPH